MQDRLPALLIIHSNLLIEISIEAICFLVAISPSTRYLVITGWSEIDFFRTIADALRIQIGVLQTVSPRDELLAVKCEPLQSLTNDAEIIGQIEIKDVPVLLSRDLHMSCWEAFAPEDRLWETAQKPSRTLTRNCLNRHDCEPLDLLAERN